METYSKMRKWFILCGIGLAGMIVNIDFTIVNTALPSLQKNLNANLSQLQWMMGAFGISFATLLTITGRIGDLFGRRLVCYIGMIGFLFASIGAGLSTHPTELIIFRFLQGLFGAPIFPCGIAIITEVFHKEKGKAIGIYTSLLGIGLAFGPVLGGLIVSTLSWRWIFFINIPVIIVSFLLLLPNLHESSKSKEKIDWWGMIFFIFGFGSLIFAITEGPNLGWRSSVIISAFIVSFLLLLFFFYVENKAEEPIIPLHLFHHRGFLLGCAVFIAAVSPIWSLFFLFPLYLQNVLGASPGETGLILLSMTIMTVIAAPLAGTILDRKGSVAVVSLIFLLAFCSYILFLFFSISGPLGLILVAFILYGTSWGMGNSVGVTLSIRHLEKGENAGIISGAVITILNVVGVLLLSIIGTLFRHSEKMFLSKTLQEEGILLHPSQEHLVRTFLSDPEQAGNILEGMRPDFISAILSHFKESFISGFHIAVGALFIIVLLTFFLLLKPLFKDSYQINRKK